jgi:hypothetical protein
MSQGTATASIADLERLLDEKRAQVQVLLEKREQTRKLLDQLDAEMQMAANFDGPVSRRGQRRIKNESSLRTVVTEILGKHKKGLPLGDLVDKVAESGYRSASRNFRNVVYQCVYHTEGIVHDEATGNYRLQR